VFWFPLQLLSETFLILRITQRDIITNVHRSSCKVPIIIVTYQSKFNLLDRFLKNIQMPNFIKNLFNGSQAENCALLGHYTASSGNFLPMFWDNLLVPSSRIMNPKRKLDVPIQSLPSEEWGQWKVLCSVVLANWDDEWVGKEGECGSQIALIRDVLWAKNSKGVVAKHMRTSTWAKCEKEKGKKV
jgi:hypothetical protein